MRNFRYSIFGALFNSSLILASLLLFTACDSSASKEKTSEPVVEETPKFANIIWNVKAIHPEGKSLDIKAFDEAGKSFDIKAIQNSDQHSFLDVKALGGGKELPVKILVNPDGHNPVKAIDKEGIAYDLKAVTADGEHMDVKGVARFGYVVIMKAISKDGDYYAVKAISPDGQMNDIKGIKINNQDRDMILKGLSVHAHVKAMHPASKEADLQLSKNRRGTNNKEFKRILWNIKAVTPEGKNLALKAFDAEGNKFDVKATQDSKQHSFMNIKAFVDGTEIPIKILDSSEEYSPIKAFGRDGTIYDIKALTEDNVKLDVKGISRSGNIVHVKAINENGDYYGVKAFAPDGTLNDVKGIKIFDRKVELKIQGNPVFAHLKAINQ